LHRTHKRLNVLFVQTRSTFPSNFIHVSIRGSKIKTKQ